MCSKRRRKTETIKRAKKNEIDRKREKMKKG
jgi:hypothetical protein